MKKVLLTLLVIAFGLSLMAVESDPSQTVGFIAIDAPAGYTYFGLPFAFMADGNETFTVADVFGDQITGGTPGTADRIYDGNDGTFAFRSTTGTWSGQLTQVVPGHYYYYWNRVADRTLYLAGNVVEEAQEFGNMSVGYHYLTYKNCRVLDLDELDLEGMTGGTPATADRIYDGNTGTFAFRSTTGTWNGQLTQITPGNVYYLWVRTAAFDYTFNPVEAPTATSVNVNVRVKRNSAQSIK